MKKYLGEINKLKREVLLYLPVCVLFYFFALVYNDWRVTEYRISGYLTSSSLLMLTVIGVYIPIIGGALMIGRERDWNTFIYMNLRMKKNKILLIKIIDVVILSTMCIFTSFLFQLILCIINGNNLKDFICDKYFIQIIVTLFLLVFWGVVAIIITLILESKILGILIPLAFNMFEYILHYKCSKNVLRFLPVFNLKGILFDVFDNLSYGSLIIVQDNNYCSLGYSIIYLFLVIMLLCLVGFRYLNKNESVY